MDPNKFYVNISFIGSNQPRFLATKALGGGGGGRVSLDIYTIYTDILIYKIYTAVMIHDIHNING